MVTSIARQSVIIKCNQQKSVLLGNYEFYYLAGLFRKLYQFDIHEEMQPAELLEHILEKLDSITPSNEQEAHLIKMVSIYRVTENYDAQMKELFVWGATEEQLWEVHI